MDARGAVDLLGTTVRVVAGLGALGLLRPYVTGGRRTKYAQIYLKVEVEVVPDRLAAGLPSRLYIEKDEASLTAAAHAYAVPLAVLCREAPEGPSAYVIRWRP